MSGKPESVQKVFEAVSLGVVARKLLLLIAAFAVSPQTLRAQTPRAYTVSGQVQDVSGQAIPGVRVCPRPAMRVQGKHFPCAVSDALGRFKLSVGEAGKYRLFADRATDGHAPQVLPFYKHPSIRVPLVTVSDARPARRVSITLAPKNGALVVDVLDAATGLHVESAQVILCHAGRPEVCFNSYARGPRYLMRASHVPFTVRVFSDGYEDWPGPGGSDTHAEWMIVESGTERELTVRMMRRGDAAGRALNEAEKVSGVHLPAPAQLAPEDGTSFDIYPRVTRLEWQAVEGAYTYRVEVDYCRRLVPAERVCVDAQPIFLKTGPQPFGLEGTTYTIEFIGAQPGRWRVWAIDRDGREGFKSPWWFFSYLR